MLLWTEILKETEITCRVMHSSSQPMKQWCIWLVYTMNKSFFPHHCINVSSSAFTKTTLPTTESCQCKMSRFPDPRSVIIDMFTCLCEPVRVNASPPQSAGAVHAEHRVARGFLVEISVQKLAVQRAQLRDVGLRAHRRARVPVPVRRTHRHRQIHGRQHAQNTSNDQSRGVAVIHHHSSVESNPKRLNSRTRLCFVPYFPPICFMPSVSLWIKVNLIKVSVCLRIYSRENKMNLALNDCLDADLCCCSRCLWVMQFPATTQINQKQNNKEIYSLLKMIQIKCL